MSFEDQLPRDYGQTLELEAATAYKRAIGVSLLALALLPAVIMLIVMGAKFRGLFDPGAVEHAQLARNINAGQGYSTSLIRPLSLGFKAQINNHPDFYNAPVHPILLAAVFHFSEQSDKSVAAAGAVTWILSVWLTFFIAWRWADLRSAVLSTMFYVGSVFAIALAIGGLPHPFASLIVLLCAAVAFNPPESQIAREDAGGAVKSATSKHTFNIDEETSQIPHWRIVAAGALSGIAAMCHFQLIAIALVFGWLLTVSSKAPTRSLMLFAGGVFIPVAPWCIRSWLILGSPVFSLYSYELLSNTASYPGDSVWRLVQPPVTPISFLIHHPFQIAQKLFAGLSVFRKGAFSVLDPWVAVLFMLGLILHGTDKNWRKILFGISLSMILFVIISCFLRPLPDMLTAWLPLTCIVAGRLIGQWLSAREREEGLTQVSYFAEGNASVLKSVGLMRLAYPCVGALICVPIISFIALSRPAKPPDANGIAAVLEKTIGRGSTVLTDQPGIAAWNARMVAIWLPQTERELAIYEDTFGIANGLFVSNSIDRMAEAERGQWWDSAGPQYTTFHGMIWVDSPYPNLVIRVREQRAGL